MIPLPPRSTLFPYTTLFRSGDRQRTEETAADHRTVRVKGAVRACPSTLHCRKRRHVPLTGRSTPTRNTPGRVWLPLTRDAPNTDVQPLVRAEHTCVWK